MTSMALKDFLEDLSNHLSYRSDLTYVATYLLFKEPFSVVDTVCDKFRTNEDFLSLWYHWTAEKDVMEMNLKQKLQRLDAAFDKLGKKDTFQEVHCKHKKYLKEEVGLTTERFEDAEHMDINPQDLEETRLSRENILNMFILDICDSLSRKSLLNVGSSLTELSLVRRASENWPDDTRQAVIDVILHWWYSEKETTKQKIQKLRKVYHDENMAFPFEQAAKKYQALMRKQRLKQD